MHLRCGIWFLAGHLTARVQYSCWCINAPHCPGTVQLLVYQCTSLPGYSTVVGVSMHLTARVQYSCWCINAPHSPGTVQLLVYQCTSLPGYSTVVGVSMHLTARVQYSCWCINAPHCPGTVQVLVYQYTSLPGYSTVVGVSMHLCCVNVLFHVSARVHDSHSHFKPIGESNRSGSYNIVHLYCQETLVTTDNVIIAR